MKSIRWLIFLLFSLGVGFCYHWYQRHYRHVDKPPIQNTVTEPSTTADTAIASTTSKASASSSDDAQSLRPSSVFRAHLLPPKGSRSMRSVLQLIAQSAQQQLRTDFAKVGLTYPPKHLTLLAIKDKKQLTLWASNMQGVPTKVRTFPILAASGVAGPKLREGDRQVPEGIYRITAFNPNSSYHLSMKLNYPNAFDKKYASIEGRTEPGSDIFIHGKAVSIGCLAMGDAAIEQLFTLVHDVGKERVTVIIAPTNPQQNTLTPPPDAPAWVGELYQNISAQMATLANGRKL